MPRSFLVKKTERRLSDHVGRMFAKREEMLAIRVPMEQPIPTTFDRPTVLQTLPSCFTSADYEENVLSQTPEYFARITDIRSASDGESEPSSVGEEDEYRDTLSSDLSSERFERFNGFQPGVTTGYTYDAFFVTDGRSRRHGNHFVCTEQPLRPSMATLAPLPSSPEEKRPRYSCSECGKHYATSSNLSRHKQTHRSLESKLAKKCTRCGKVYVSMPALAMHLLTHELRHQCPICEKPFSRPWLLQGHMRSHTGEKPYGCSHCGKAFADRSNLRAHMQTHSTFKHYRCRRCSKSFALKSYLNKHYESACFKDNVSEAMPGYVDSNASQHNETDDEDNKIDVVG